MDKCKLKREPYMCAKISVLKSNLLSDESLNEFVNLSFEEILLRLQESQFSFSIDKSYSKYDGFYLIENILNSYLSKISQKILTGVSKQNKELIEKFEFNYQIENFLIILRMRYLNLKEDITVYLRGDDKKKKFYIEANNFSRVEDIILFISKKLNLNSKEILEIYNRNFFQLENYLYKNYYKNLINLNLKYNKKDEKLFSEFLKRQLDITNIGSVLFLSEIDDIKKREELFDNLYTQNNGGSKIKKEDLKQILIKTNIIEMKKELLSLANNIHPKLKIDNISQIDDLKFFNMNLLLVKFRILKFSSPFVPIKYLLELRRNLEKIKIILKSKQMKVDKSVIEGLLN